MIYSSYIQLLPKDEELPQCMDYYGLTIVDYIQDIIQNIRNKYINTIANSQNLDNLKYEIDNKLHFLNSKLNINAHATIIQCNDSVNNYTIETNLSIPKNNPLSNNTKMVFLNLEKDSTHNWKEHHYKKNNYVCIECNLKKIHIDTFTNINDQPLVMADYDLSCDEMIIKDIIE